MDDEDEGAHSAVIGEQIKWRRHPCSDEYVFYINFDYFITRDELYRTFEEKFGVCQDWKIPKRRKD